MTDLPQELIRVTAALVTTLLDNSGSTTLDRSLILLNGLCLILPRFQLINLSAIDLTLLRIHIDVSNLLNMVFD